MPIKMWLFPGLSYSTVLGIVAVLVAMGIKYPDLQSQLTTTLLLIVALLVIYFVFRRGRYVAAGSEPGLIRKTAPEIVLVEDNRDGRNILWQAGDHQSVADRNGVSLAEYIHALFGLLVQKAPPCADDRRRGGTLATMLTRTGVAVTLVDIDPLAFEIARLYFHMPAGGGMPGRRWPAAFLRRGTRDAMTPLSWMPSRRRKFRRISSSRLLSPGQDALKRGGIFLINIAVADDATDPVRTDR